VGACRPAEGRQAPAKSLRANKFFLFTYKSLPPLWRAVGVQNCKLWNRKYISVKNDFEKYKNKKNAKDSSSVLPKQTVDSTVRLNWERNLDFWHFICGASQVWQIDSVTSFFPNKTPGAATNDGSCRFHRYLYNDAGFIPIRLAV